MSRLKSYLLRVLNSDAIDSIRPKAMRSVWPSAFARTTPLVRDIPPHLAGLSMMMTADRSDSR